MPSMNDNKSKQDKASDQNRRDIFRAFSVLSQLGITIIACIAVGITIGWFLDKWLHTSPWLLLTCSLFGVVAAFRSIFDFAKKQ